MLPSLTGSRSMIHRSVDPARQALIALALIFSCSAALADARRAPGPVDSIQVVDARGAAGAVTPPFAETLAPARHPAVQAHVADPAEGFGEPPYWVSTLLWLAVMAWIAVRYRHLD
jgi:hypothetical protein